ncbi:unnamed protein product [Rhizoctonia solani]|uniref:Uncharacterized protein n=1 Tax=Rhizoctonia solani TaxID=456999 RepID=A0A8H2ZYT3_9AGAM|nr:unnamed protein product [Rhizoctonia solani]
MNIKGAGPDISRYQLSMIWTELPLPFIYVREKTRNAILLVSIRGAIGLFWAVTLTPPNWISVVGVGFFLGSNTLGRLTITSARAPPSPNGIVVSIMIGLGLAGILSPLVFDVAIEKVSSGLRILPSVVIVLASLSALVFWTIPPYRKVNLTKPAEVDSPVKR